MALPAYAQETLHECAAAGPSRAHSRDEDAVRLVPNLGRPLGGFMGIRALVHQSLAGLLALSAASLAGAQPPAALTGRVNVDDRGRDGRRAREPEARRLEQDRHGREPRGRHLRVPARPARAGALRRLDTRREIRTRRARSASRDHCGRPCQARSHAARQQPARARAAAHGPRVVRELPARRPHQVGAVSRLQPLPHDAPPVDVDLRCRGARVGHDAHGVFGRQLADALSTPGQRNAALGPHRRRRAVGLAAAPGRGRRVDQSPQRQRGITS